MDITSMIRNRYNWNQHPATDSKRSVQGINTSCLRQQTGKEYILPETANGKGIHPASDSKRKRNTSCHRQQTGNEYILPQTANGKEIHPASDSKRERNTSCLRQQTGKEYILPQTANGKGIHPASDSKRERNIDHRIWYQSLHDKSGRKEDSSFTI